MTTLTLMTLCFALAAVAGFTADWLERRAKKREREIIRRLHTYMAQLPPARPW